MKIALFGATGSIGSRILEEALQRGHEVTAIVREPSKLPATDPKLQVVPGDITDANSYLPAVHGVDAVVISVSPRGNTSGADLLTLANNLLASLPAAGVKRLLWVGGAGSLEVAPGVRAVDTDGFPAEYKVEALALGDVLDVLRASSAGIDWTFISPPFVIAPGERTGQYRLGGDQPLFDAQGNSRISNEDYAVALLDRVEKNDAPRKRITVGY
jgi:putative NADH-flavin reductase